MDYPNGNWTPYSAHQGGYGGTAGGGEDGTYTLSGEITTVYDWVPAKIPNPDPVALADGDPSNDQITDPLDLPPKEVIVVESCTASFSSIGFPSDGGGSCDSGLGFPEVLTPINVYAGPGILIGHRTDGISTGTRYTKKAGATSLTVTCSPSVSATTIRGTSGGTVVYNYSIIVPSISVSGLTRRTTLAQGADGYFFLTGQQLTGSVLGAGLNVKSGTHKWSVMGGDPFKNYVATTALGKRTELAAGDKMQPNLSFYTVKDEPVQLSCDVEFEFPTGAKLEGGLPKMTLGARPFTSVRPAGDFKVKNGQTDFGSGLNGASAIVYGGLINSNDLGQLWQGIEVTSPPLFATNGKIAFLQLITPNRKLVRANSGNRPTTFVKDFPNGVEALDTGFPYPFGYSGPIISIGGGPYGDRPT